MQCRAMTCHATPPLTVQFQCQCHCQSQRKCQCQCQCHAIPVRAEPRNAVWCGAEWSSVVLCVSTVSHSAMWSNAVLCGALRCGAVQHSGVVRLCDIVTYAGVARCRTACAVLS
eukprot:4215236-Alexandrium_andersonii.AAC.1